MSTSSQGKSKERGASSAGEKDRKEFSILRNPISHSQLSHAIKLSSGKYRDYVIVLGYMYTPDTIINDWKFKIRGEKSDINDIDLNWYYDKDLRTSGLADHKRFFGLINLKSTVAVNEPLQIEITGRDGKTIIELTVDVKGETEPESIALIKDFSNSTSSKKGLIDDLINAEKWPATAFMDLVPISEKADYIQIHIDSAVQTPKGIFFMGWLAELMSGDYQYFLSDNQKLTEINLDQVRFFRSDVINFLNNQNYKPNNENCGFKSFIPLGKEHESTTINEIIIKLPDDKLVNLLFQNKTIVSRSQMLTLSDSIFSGLTIEDPTIVNQFDQIFGPLLEQFGKDLDPNFKPQTITFNESVSNPKVSFIIPIYGRFDYIAHQLSAFSADRFIRGNCEILFVVDDPRIVHETISEVKMQTSYYPLDVKVITYKENLGYAGANNVGVQEASGELVLLLNSDVFPKESGWLELLISALESDLNIGAVGPTLLYEDKTVQHIGMFVKKGNYPLQDLFWNEHYHKGVPYKFVKGTEDLMAPKPMYGITGACLLMSKELYKQIDGFDEAYIYGDFEDSDLCLKIKEKGLSTCHIEKPVLYHLERKSQNLFENLGTKFNFTIYNSWRFRKTWEPKLNYWIKNK